MSSITSFKLQLCTAAKVIFVAKAALWYARFLLVFLHRNWSLLDSVYNLKLSITRHTLGDTEFFNVLGIWKKIKTFTEIHLL